MFSSLEYVPRIRIVGPEYYHVKDSFCLCFCLPFYFLLPVSVCLPVSVHIMCVCLQRSQEDFGSPGARITGDSKLSDMGAGN